MAFGEIVAAIKKIFAGYEKMSYITTNDGVEIYYKDWGSGSPIVFSHGWPLSSDDWDTHMMFFVNHGFRVVAHDRRGHGRSSQTGDGHDMDHYADDLAAVTNHLDLKGAVHIGHSTGGGEVVWYIARHGEDRVAKAVLISSVPPLMLKTTANPGGTPKEVFDGFQAQVANNRAQFYRDFAAGPFYGYNRPGAKQQEGIIENCWRQGMMGGAKAHYDGIVAFAQTDFTEDLKKDHRARVGDARRRRSGRPVRRRWAVVGKAREDRGGFRCRHAVREALIRLQRSVGFHQELRGGYSK